jgi:thiamine biosynthesis lipoprotein
MPVAGGVKFSFKAMGTLCQVTYATNSRVAGEAFKQATVKWVADFEARYSRFIPDSLIGQINATAGIDWVGVDQTTDRLLSFCHQLVFFTGGAFDPTALPLVKLWNWKTESPVVPSDAAIQRARELVGWDKVQRRPGAIFLPVEGMGLDLGGVGKEYAVDCVVDLAQQHGIANVLVDFGQDVRAQGEPRHIGLEDPQRPGQCWTGVAVKDMAVATSGDYLRCFQINGRRYGHILDPRTGYTVHNGCRAVTVIAPSCTVAGILSTTAFILGQHAGIKLIEGYFGAEGCILTEDSRSETRRFSGYVTN